MHYAFDGTSLAGSVASLKNNKHSCAACHDPWLHLYELQLQAFQLFLIRCLSQTPALSVFVRL